MVTASQPNVALIQTATDTDYQLILEGMPEQKRHLSRVTKVLHPLPSKFRSASS